MAERALRFPLGEGYRTGMLTVVGPVGRKFTGGKARPCYPVKCDCGTEKIVLADLLRHRRVKSCGCAEHEVKTHRGVGSVVYARWSAMKSRCYYPKHKKWGCYGGRGIQVCEEWRDNFEAFRDWALANGFREDLELDRKDTNGHYSPENCRWATRVEQCNNMRRTVWVTAFNETKSLPEWARDPRCQPSEQTLRSRVCDYGWPPEEAITRPTMARSDCGRHKRKTSKCYKKRQAAKEMGGVLV